MQWFVDLPPTQESGIAGIVAALLALAFDYLIGVLPFLAFLRIYQEGFALALSGLVVSAIENALPTGSEALSIPGVEFLIAIAVYLLVRIGLKRLGTRGFV